MSSEIPNTAEESLPIDLSDDAMPNPRPGSSRDRESRPEKRRNLPRRSVRILRLWLYEHREDPFPNRQEKENLAEDAELTMLQVSDWFINSRRRTLGHMFKEGYDPIQHAIPRKSGVNARRSVPTSTRTNRSMDSSSSPNSSKDLDAGREDSDNSTTSTPSQVSLFQGSCPIELITNSDGTHEQELLIQPPSSQVDLQSSVFHSPLSDHGETSHRDSFEDDSKEYSFRNSDNSTKELWTTPPLIPLWLNDNFLINLYMLACVACAERDQETAGEILQHGFLTDNPLHTS